jgi:hypothetical protein
MTEDHIAGTFGEGAGNNAAGKDMSHASGGGAAVNIRFGDDDARGGRRPIKTMDDLYLELTRQLQRHADQMADLRVEIAGMKHDIARFSTLASAFEALEKEFEALRDEMALHGIGNGTIIAKATLGVAVLIALAVGVLVWILSNGG